MGLVRANQIPVAESNQSRQECQRSPGRIPPPCAGYHDSKGGHTPRYGVDHGAEARDGFVGQRRGEDDNDDQANRPDQLFLDQRAAEENPPEQDQKRHQAGAHETGHQDAKRGFVSKPRPDAQPPDQENEQNRRPDAQWADFGLGCFRHAVISAGLIDAAIVH